MSLMDDEVSIHTESDLGDNGDKEPRHDNSINRQESNAERQDSSEPLLCDPQSGLLMAIEKQTKLLSQFLDNKASGHISRSKKRKSNKRLNKKRASSSSSSSSSTSSSSSSCSSSSSPSRKKQKRRDSSPSPARRTPTHRQHLPSPTPHSSRSGGPCGRTNRSLSPGELITSADELEREIRGGNPQLPTGQFTTGESLFEDAEAELVMDDETGPPLTESVAKFVANRFNKKLGDNILKRKLGEYKRPSNGPQLSAPKTNDFIWKALRPPYRRNDARLTNAQQNIAKATTAVATAVNSLNCMKEQSPELQSTIGHLLDAVSVLGHTHQHLTSFRKDAQRYALPYDYKGVCDVEAGDSNFLYGDDIKRTLREAKEEKRLASSLTEESGYAGRNFKKGKSFLGRQKPSGQKQLLQKGRNFQQGPFRQTGPQMRRKQK